MNMTKLSDTRTLSNGCGIPCVGFGTFLIPNGAPTAAAVKAAVESGELSAERLKLRSATGSARRWPRGT